MKGSMFYRDTWVEVNLDAIYTNVANAKHHVGEGTEVIAAVKANAYGHGYVPVAKTALEAGASRLAVAFLDEALLLRKEGITAPILVLGASRPEDAAIAAEYNIALTVFRSEWLEQVKQGKDFASPLSLHFKFDTGMGRLGIQTEEELASCLGAIEDSPFFFLEGAYTHFATADSVDVSYFEGQYARFLQQLEWMKERDVHPPLIHCANSAASLRFSQCIFNTVRIGIAMYGLTPSPEINHLLPYPLQEAFSLHSKITHVKQVKIGSGISYGATYKAKEKEWIATVPVGYADGWIRKMQGFEVLADGHRVPIVGRVCMDQFMVRLPHELPVGTKITLLGKQNRECVSIDDAAAHAETINYEIPCLISFRVPRVYIKNGAVFQTDNILVDSEKF
ncbi:alanine racemase [Bacillus sp. OTU530]|uniref:alanine racemase n=1 Tax=Bacillus sp. OTU530 TaxID=3043862 RepID=UPI00313E50A1